MKKLCSSSSCLGYCKTSIFRSLVPRFPKPEILGTRLHLSLCTCKLHCRLCVLPTLGGTDAQLWELEVIHAVVSLHSWNEPTVMSVLCWCVCVCVVLTTPAGGVWEYICMVIVMVARECLHSSKRTSLGSWMIHWKAIHFLVPSKPCWEVCACSEYDSTCIRQSLNWHTPCSEYGSMILLPRWVHVCTFRQNLKVESLMRCMVVFKSFDCWDMIFDFKS